MPDLGTTKIINLKDLGGAGTEGHRMQPFTGDGVTTTFTITDWVPDDDLTMEVGGIGSDTWTLVGSDVVFDWAPKNGVKIKAIN